MKGYNDKIIFTAEELNQFSKTPSTIIELSNIIDDKTNGRFVIITKEFVEDISKQLFDNTLRIYDINNFLNEIWTKVVSTNQPTTDKWKEELKQFEN